MKVHQQNNMFLASSVICEAHECIRMCNLVGKHVYIQALRCIVKTLNHMVHNEYSSKNVGLQKGWNLSRSANILRANAT